MTGEQALKQTPLFESHVAAGAKMVPFAGWEMPVQYAGVIPEHRAVRNAVGLFDVSHMGEILLEGKGAFELLDYLTCNELRKLQVGRAQYSAFTTPSGGIVDDIIIYKYSDSRFFICVNASNSDKDYAWITEHNKSGVAVTNLSAEYAQIAVQGPEALKLISLMPGLSDACQLRGFSFIDMPSDWGNLTIARTGYTGEDGVEIFVTPKNAVSLWRALLEIGSSLGVQPIGLGARDTLRLEACLPLHGHELSEQITAIESGLSWIVKPHKGDFLGRSILEPQQREGAPRTLIGLVLDQPGIARQDDKVLTLEGREIGLLTSGTRTPTINKAIGLALVETSHTETNTPIQVSVRGKPLAAHIVERPFYRRAKKV